MTKHVGSFVIGAVAGMMALEALMFMDPYHKRMMMRKGRRLVRAAVSAGERIF